MEFTKCMLFTTAWLIVQTANAKTCVLDRNEYNKYPFVVRIVLQGQLLAHGSLITPLRVLSAYGPFDSITGDISNLEFTAQVLEKGGNVQCLDTRRPKSQELPDNCALGYLNTACWVMGEPFLVTFNYPFLYTRLEDMHFNNINKQFQDTKNLEKCELPVYSLIESSMEVKLVPGLLTYIGKDSPEQKTWSDLACKDDKTCRINTFFGINPNDQCVDSRWCEGAVVLCHGSPIGMMISVVEDPSSKKRSTQFLRLQFATKFLAWAVEEWPKPPASAATSPTQRTSTKRTSETSFSKSTTLSSSSKGIVTTPRRTVHPRSSTFPTTRTTLSRIKIPSAPTMTHLKTTIQKTTLFIRTRPKKVRPQFDIGSIRKISSVVTFICNAFLILT